MLHSSLAALAVYSQWVLYKVVPSEARPGKTDKLPCDWKTGKLVNAHNPDNWTDYTNVEKAASERGSGWGTGFVFTARDPFWFLDFDDAYDPKKNSWSETAMRLFQMFPGCAAEISISRTGGHIFGTGVPPHHACKNVPLGLEFYHEGRFAAISQLGAMGDIRTDATAQLPALVAEFFPAGAEVSQDQEWTEAPVAEWRGPVTDEDLIRRAMQARSANAAFDGKAGFAELWLADEKALAKSYPDAKRAWDGSGADMALAMHLAFWTGKDCARIERLMWESKLVRSKWEEREDYYLPRTIMRACARQQDVCQDRTTPTPASGPGGLSLPPSDNGAKLRTGGNGGMMNRDQYPEYFAGLVYVINLDRAYAPGGYLLKQSQFKNVYGGYKFALDNTNEKVTRDAWEAWTQNEVYEHRRVDGTCFKPNLEPGAIIERDGQTFVNIYQPISVRRMVGDPSPFYRHLAKTLPDERDQTILLSYMAACVQFKGVKFQWAPLLQGVEGNGKTFFARCVSEAIGRRYCHFPPANEISEKFNSWLFDTIFISVEDIYVPNQKQEVFEILKPMITSDYMARRAMQTDQVMREVVANFFFNSNHRDGLKKTKNDRRICTLFCAQQKVGDLARDGMTGDYFSELYAWLNADGYAIVADLLMTYAIPAEFNPAGECQRAPFTSTTEEAILASAGHLEQEIEECIGQQLPGFSGGFISSVWLDRLLDRMRMKVGHSKRRDMLEQMGYVLHPALHDGRTNNIVIPDNSKPRLFVKKDSLLMQINNAADVAKEYERANRGVPMVTFRTG